MKAPSALTVLHAIGVDPSRLSSQVVAGGEPRGIGEKPSFTRQPHMFVFMPGATHGDGKCGNSDGDLLGKTGKQERRELREVGLRE